MEVMTLILVSVILVLISLWWSNRKPPGFPPGPMGVPILGYFPFLGELPHRTLAKLGSEYGRVFSISLGKERAVVLNDWMAMKEALVKQSESYSGRPRTFLFEEIFHQKDIVSTDGPLWKDKRRFTLHHLKDFGFGQKSMEVIIEEEVTNVLNCLKDNINQKIDPAELFFIPMLNILWGIIAGKKYARNDQKMQEFSVAMKRLSEDFLKDLPVNALPMLRFLPGSPHRKLMKTHYEIMDFLKEEVEEHLSTYKDGSERDFIDAYLAEIRCQNKLDQPNPAFKKDHLIGILYNFFSAGVETIDYTLLWALLYISLWPEIQEKIHQELDNIIGRKRRPVYRDRARLPYTEAVLLETHRYATVVPLSVPHTTMKTTQLLGYSIPKGTQVIQNLWAVHFDPKYWEQPESFRPERFLNQWGQVKKPEYLIPFSTGSRSCLGEPLARMELFLFFSAMLQDFSFHCIPKEKPTIEPVVSLTLRPQPFSLIIKER